MLSIIKLVQIKCSGCSLKENLVTLSMQVEGKHLLSFTVILFILSEFIECILRENRLTTTKNEREAVALFSFPLILLGVENTYKDLALVEGTNESK